MPREVREGRVRTGDRFGVFGFDRILTELLAVIGESVKVLIATSGGEEAYATFAGTLTRGEDSPIWAVAGRVDEAITFRVGESSYFVLYRRASTYGEDQSTDGVRGLSITQGTVDIIVWCDRRNDG
jgi:hypothetical protein